MKKTLIILTLIYMFCLYGCSNDKTALKEEKPTLTLIGHASCKIKTLAGTVIYIDPWYDGDYTEVADICLVTHGHSDHYKAGLIKKDDDTVMITESKALIDKKYQTFDILDVHIEAVMAGGNQNHSIKDCVGYLITFDGITVYHAGDTSYLDSMVELGKRNIDYALYPIDGEYNMDAIEATKAANTVGAIVNIPMHVYVAKKNNYELNMSKFTPLGVNRLGYGNTLDLDKHF